MRTSSRPVAVVLFDEVELLDVCGAVHALSICGRQWNYRPFKILTVATRPGPVETRNQVRVVAQFALDACLEPEVVFVPGGYGARRALNDAKLVEWLALVGSRAEHVLAVGAGALLVAKAGHVGDSEVAVPHELSPLLAELCPTARIDTVARVATSGKLMTASSALAGVDMALAFIEKLLGAKQARTVASAIGIISPTTDTDPLKVRIVDTEPPKPGA